MRTGDLVALQSAVSLVSGATFSAGESFIVARTFESSRGVRLCLADTTGRICIPCIAPELVEPARPTDSGLRDLAGCS